MLLAIVGCNEGIDPITYVPPGDDLSAPTVSLTFPSGDLNIPFTDTEVDLDIKFRVEDDIRIDNVSVVLDGETIHDQSDFLDYRIYLGSEFYESLGLGDHEMTLTAKDASGKTTTETLSFNVSNKYLTKYDGELFYMPFEFGLYTELVSETDPTVVGEPGFGDGKVGTSYKGAADSYLTFPTDGLIGEEFSATMWYKVNADPDRGGILVIGPPDDGNPSAQNNRNSGFRFFRENAGGMQRVKLNVGNGTADTWFDGGAAADIDPNKNEWVHLAFTISSTECVVYINGEVVSQGDFDGVDWTGCDIVSIMSGEPRFGGWGHASDLSNLDDLRIYSKALSEGEVKAIME